jgi:GrpB-like predicted nucleotidyltransferase (UPF0157 family)
LFAAEFQGVGQPVSIFQSTPKPNAEYNDWDPRYPEVVRSLLSEVAPCPPGVALEHVGSTAIQGCGGKGIIDLLALYPDGSLDGTKRWLLGLGLNRQGPEFSRPWPETRPMYLGSFLYLGQAFVIYVHVVRQAADEVRRFRVFRDLLCRRPDLVTEYCAIKRQILASGVTDTDDYKVKKRPFMHKALGADHALSDEDA